MLQKHKRRLSIGLMLSTKMLQHYFHQTKQLDLAQATYHTQSSSHRHEPLLLLVCVRVTAQDMCSLAVTSLRHLIRKSDISESLAKWHIVILLIQMSL